METVETPVQPVQDGEYRVCLLDGLSPSRAEWRRAAIGTSAVHAAVLILLLLIPRQMPYREPELRRVTHFTPLIDPPTRLTQRAPNKQPISDLLTAGPVLPSPPVPKPAPQPTRKFAPPPPQTAYTPRKVSPAVPQEPPRLANAQQPTSPIAPPVTIQPEQPKLVLENPTPAPQLGQGTGRIKVPGAGVQDVLKEVVRKPSAGVSVGDDTNDVGSLSFNTTPSPTRPKTQLELLSDPQGVDFKPYITQVLQNVRRNWFSVMPESARLGQRGRVVVQFAIARDGKITKVIFSSESNVRAFDRAAVAALSASDPLPELPPAFKGDRVVLQFTFLYNAPK